MQIDRSNYEIWLIDWLDGTLNEIQERQLHSFLKENPDLKEEFDDLTAIRLNPPEKSFPNKQLLKKTNADLSDSQFEYLCAAFFENDLSAAQETELKKSIDKYPEKKRSFELIQKTRLSPVAVSYKHKNTLYRRTVAQNAIRLSLIGLSAAAIITLIIITWFSGPRTLPCKSEKAAQIVIDDSPVQKPAFENTADKIYAEKKIISRGKQSKNMLAVPRKTVAHITRLNIDQTTKNDSLATSSEHPRTLLEKIHVSSDISLKKESIPNALIAFNSTVTAPEYDDGRSRFSKYIAKTFREKILKDKTAKDNPLKGYEIAEAGVSGLNKLFGWEMALDKKNDENGELKSVYFSSKLLKFNAPVKKSELVQ